LIYPYWRYINHWKSAGGVYRVVGHNKKKNNKINANKRIGLPR